jgi:hypothetical protein
MVTGKPGLVYLKMDYGKRGARMVSEEQLAPIGLEGSLSTLSGRVRLAGKKPCPWQKGRELYEDKGLEPSWDPSTYTEYGPGEGWKRWRDALWCFVGDKGVRPGPESDFHRYSDALGYLNENASYIHTKLHGQVSAIRRRAASAYFVTEKV